MNIFTFKSLNNPLISEDFQRIFLKVILKGFKKWRFQTFQRVFRLVIKVFPNVFLKGFQNVFKRFQIGFKRFLD